MKRLPAEEEKAKFNLFAEDIQAYGIKCVRFQSVIF